MTYRRAAHAAWRRIGDETVVINLETRRMVCLDVGGSAIWERLDGGAEMAELAAVLAPTAAAAVAPTVSELVAALAREGLVEPAGLGETVTPAAAVGDLPVGFVPPRITWSEELLRFGGACGKPQASGLPCSSYPKDS